MREKLSTNTLNHPIQSIILEVTQTIEDIVEELDVSYMEACVVYAERFGIEIETIGEIIEKNQCLKAKIQAEAEDLHYLKRSPRIF